MLAFSQHSCGQASRESWGTDITCAVLQARMSLPGIQSYWEVRFWNSTVLRLLMWSSGEGIPCCCKSAVNIIYPSLIQHWDSWLNCVMHSEMILSIEAQQSWHKAQPLSWTKYCDCLLIAALYLLMCHELAHFGLSTTHLCQILTEEGAQIRSMNKKKN